MGDYSVVSDKDGIMGLWLRDRNMVNPGTIGVLLTKVNQAGEYHVPVEWFGRIMKSNYSVVPNTVDTQGGVFVIFRGTMPTRKATPAPIFTGSALSTQQSLAPQVVLNRITIARRLGQPLDPEAVEFLIKVVLTAHPLLQINAAMALGDCRDPRAVEALVKCLQSSDPRVAKASLDALRKINDPGTRPILDSVAETIDLKATQYKRKRLKTWIFTTTLIATIFVIAAINDGITPITLVLIIGLFSVIGVILSLIDKKLVKNQPKRLNTTSENIANTELSFPQRTSASLEDNFKETAQKYTIKGLDDSVFNLNRNLLSSWEHFFETRPLDIPFYTALNGRAYIAILFSNLGLPHEQTLKALLDSGYPFGLQLRAFLKGSYPIIRANFAVPTDPSEPLILEAPLDIKNGNVQDFCQAILADEHVDLIMRHADSAEDHVYSVPCIATGLAAVIRNEVSLAIRALKPTATSADFNASARIMEQVFPKSYSGVQPASTIPLTLMGEAPNKQIEESPQVANSLHQLSVLVKNRDRQSQPLIVDSLKKSLERLESNQYNDYPLLKGKVTGWLLAETSGGASEFIYQQTEKMGSTGIAHFTIIATPHSGLSLSCLNTLLKNGVEQSNIGCIQIQMSDAEDDEIFSKARQGTCEFLILDPYRIQSDWDFGTMDDVAVNFIERIKTKSEDGIQVTLFLLSPETMTTPQIEHAMRLFERGFNSAAYMKDVIGLVVVEEARENRFLQQFTQSEEAWELKSVKENIPRAIHANDVRQLARNLELLPHQNNEAVIWTLLENSTSFLESIDKLSSY